MRLNIAALTHLGKVRDHNEDTIAVSDWVTHKTIDTAKIFDLKLDIPQLLLVADGMGGHQGGEVASQWVASILSKTLIKNTQNEASLTTAIQATNRELFDQMAGNPTLLGMGSTIAGLYLHNDLAWVMNVGDSRVYRVQGDFLAQLSIDDVLEQPAYGDEMNHHKTGRITQALGGANNFIEIIPHLRQINLREGDVFLLCSDGLSDMLNLDEMERALEEDLQQSIHQLFTQAMSAGGLDNISILLARVEH